ncbi:MAG TPA: DUF4982 domain-containing protein [Candidatus Pullilachnospira gallistercoris]|uniref:DUF4982 domain-containing protein n=1 Tax=Candidatus Pullilachnospira gallistercoris TaxID=2840911 RepID=A0A9D1E8V6_9FIRM|nr:DUF4982 domain-containing protein [Candidatus Pullilachnospira gallistercoris]
MIREKWNADWKFKKGGPSLMGSLMGGEDDSIVVQLPHDAMVHEERTPDTANGTQTGYWPSGIYTYEKTLFAPGEWKDKTAILEFEGVYSNAMVYVNEDLAATQLYGYGNFYVVLDKYLNYGADNQIMVIANNVEPNSRWYSGSGIYRDVNLMVGARIHIPADGVRITTPTVDPEASVVEICVDVKNLSRDREKVNVVSTITFDDKVVGEDTSVVTMFGQEQEEVIQRICIKDAKLWDCDNPNLYQCQVKIYAGEELLDETDEHFGIRRLELDAEHGLRINGKQVKFRGTCIHHDNGVIGATTLAKAEERRCRQMKEAGFNSIRSAHHPMSKAMLDACDKYGMLVMDELSDMWTKHKNPNDYALYFLEHVDAEVKSMVKKDYNHPSVVLYSAGNEIPDLGRPRGAQINRHICNLFHEMDPYRFTTNAINGMLAAGAKMGLIMKDVMAEMEKMKAAQPEGKEEEGASALNSMMAFMVGDAADAFACHPLMTETIEEASQAMDITGLNYLTGRHELEKELHPNKTVLGTETYPADIVRLWDIVEKNDHVLGDFTWTGYDYLGEAGCGVFYYDGTMNFNGVYPDRIAYIGDINIIGYRRPISYLREIVFGLRKEPYIAVERVDKYGMPHSQTAWMWKDNVSSWTWPGYEGKPANVDVLSGAEEVELFLNGKSLGRKPAGKANKFAASYEMTYEPGELVAVSYENGQETGRYTLKTAGDDVVLTVDCEGEKLKADGEDLAFVTVRLTDQDGIDNLFAEKEVTVSVEGAGTLQGFGSADPRAIGSYDDTTWKTFDGYVMAVVRAGREAGEIKVTFTAEGCEPKTVTIAVE